MVTLLTAEHGESLEWEAGQAWRIRWHAGGRATPGWQVGSTGVTLTDLGVAALGAGEGGIQRLSSAPGGERCMIDEGCLPSSEAGWAHLSPAHCPWSMSPFLLLQEQ